MIPTLCTVVCTAALAAIAVLGILTMHKMKAVQAKGGGQSAEKAVAPYVSATFAAIAVFIASAAVYLIQGM